MNYYVKQRGMQLLPSGVSHLSNLLWSSTLQEVQLPLIYTSHAKKEVQKVTSYLFA